MVADDKINKRKSSTIRLEWCCVMPLVLLRQKLPSCGEAVGELCLDIEIYLKVLEAVHAALWRDGVQVLFSVLNRHCEASKRPVIT